MKNKQETFIRILIHFLWMGFVYDCNAQAFPLEDDFTLFTVKDGLPDNLIKTIVQDNNGFIWLGTSSGLSCFDGNHFTNYYKSDDLSKSLPSDFIFSLVKRPDGKIYVGTLNGIALLDPIKRTFKSVRVKVDDALMKPANSFGALVLLPNGDLVGGSAVGISVFDTNLNLVFQYVHYKPEDAAKMRFQFINSILPQSDGNCLIIGKGGLWRYHGVEHRMELLDLPFMDIKHYIVMRNFGVNDLTIFFDPASTGDTILIANTTKGTISKTIYVPANELDFAWAVQFKLLNDSVVIALSHLQGIFVGNIDPQTLSFHLDKQKMLPEYHVVSAFSDKEKRIWLGSQYGLLVQSFTRQHFRHYPLTALKNEYGIQPYVRGITRIKNHFYVGISDKGVWEFDTKFNHPESVPSLALKNIWNLNNWNSDTLYAGTQLGLFSCNKDLIWIQSQQIGPGGSTFYQYQDRKGYIWAGFHGGVLRYDPHVDEKLIWTSKDSTHYFPYNDAWGITETDSGYIWMCGDGWHRWNPHQMIFDKAYTALPGTENEAGSAYNVSSNGGEELIFSIFNNGIWKWKPGTKAEKLPIANRSFQYVEEIFPDPAPHCFWLVLKAGIGFLNVETGQYRFFNEISGLPAGEVIHGFFLDAKSDSMYIGMDNGVLAFRRSDFAFSSDKPSVFITGVTLINDSLLPDISKPVTLNPSDRDFSIQFSCPEYEYASNLKYEYRLSNHEWTALEHATSARFANLGAGKYQFEVRAASPNGTISTPATLLIEILPFYYESWWFKTLILVAIAGIIFLWFRWRLTQLQKLEKMRQSIAADLHDEVGASLTSLQILAELAGRNKNPQEQNEVLSRLRTQTKKATASLREIVWNIHPKNDRLEMFVGELSRYAGEILEDAVISYSIHADPIGPDEKLAIASRQQLARVYKEILSNLIRHSKATNTEISFTKESNSLVICIRDNGVGFDPQTTERGNGLNNITDRIKMIKGHIQIQSAVNAGTKITFSCRLL